MTDQSRDLKIAAAALAEFLGKGKEKELGGGNWMSCCPAHDDNTPSLGIYVDEQIRLACFTGCSDTEVRKAIADLNFTIPSFSPSKDKAQSSSEWEINKLAHEPVPSDEWFLSAFERLPDHLYTYTDAQGRVAFHVCRFNAIPPTTKKEIKPVSSATSKLNGTSFWVKRHYADKNRPLYNLKELNDRPEAPVLIVEGEKAADRAREMLPDYVVMTWSGGSSVAGRTSWTPLVNRNVTLWPDNDGPGVKCMKEVASILGRSSKKANSVRLVFNEVVSDFPDGFDLGDPYDEGAYPALSDMLGDAQTIDLSHLPNEPAPLDDEEIIAKVKALTGRYAAMENGAEVLYVDLLSGSPHHTKLFPFSVYTKGSLEQKEVELYTDIHDKRQTRRKIIDLFFDNPKKTWMSGYVYDPGNPDRFIKIGNQLKLNLYVGLANPPAQCELFQYQCFVDHVRASLKSDEAEYLLDWLAFVVQYPEQMVGTMVVLSGRQGCGKTIVCDIVRAILGRHNSVKIGMSELTSQFNSQYANKLFIDAEEYNPGNTKIMKELREKVKNLVTSESMIVNSKGTPAFENPTFHSVIATTNSPDPEEISFDNRRMSFLRFDNPNLLMDGRIIRDPNYFAPLYRLKGNPTALAGLCHWLMTRQIDVSKVTKPIETEMSEEAMEFVDNPAFAFMKQLAETGELPDYDDMPDNDNPYPVSQWPKQACVLPRKVLSGMFHSFCRDRFINISPEKASRSILRTLMRSKKNKSTKEVSYTYPRGVPDTFDINNAHQSWSMKRIRDGATYTFRCRSVCIPDIEELRFMVEQMAGTEINWSKFSSGNTQADTVVVDFPRKPGPDDPF